MMFAVTAPRLPDRPAARRGRPRLLDERRIVAAALRLASQMRLEDVSMRALAQELGVPVMTVYNYVPNRDALHELVTDHILRPVRVPSPEEGGWEDRLRWLERDARRAVGEYPGVSLSGRHSGAAEAVRLTEGVMSILADAGFRAADAALAFATLFTFMIGQIEMDASAVSTEALEGVARTSRLSRDEVFEFGFDAVLEGLKAKLEPKRPAPRRRHSR